MWVEFFLKIYVVVILMFLNNSSPSFSKKKKKSTSLKSDFKLIGMKTYFFVFKKYIYNVKGCINNTIKKTYNFCLTVPY